MYHHFCKWRRRRRRPCIIEALQVKLDNDGCIDWELWCVDGSRSAPHALRPGLKKGFQRHLDEPADHALGRSRGGFGSKFHVVTDRAGTPLAIEVNAGQMHESTRAEPVIGQPIATLIGRRRKKRRRRHKPRQLAGDKAYSVQRVRDWLAGEKIEPVIPHKANEAARHKAGVWFDRVAWMLQLAMIRRHLRLLFSDRAWYHTLEYRRSPR